jgi:hypothetical protein
VALLVVGFWLLVVSFGLGDGDRGSLTQRAPPKTKNQKPATNNQHAPEAPQ